VEDFPGRIDRLLHSISNVYMDDHQLSALLDGPPGARGPKKAYSASGYDNPGYTGPKGPKAPELSKVDTH
jgi:hypothetical protein